MLTLLLQQAVNLFLSWKAVSFSWMILGYSCVHVSVHADPASMSIGREVMWNFPAEFELSLGEPRFKYISSVLGFPFVFRREIRMKGCHHWAILDLHKRKITCYQLLSHLFCKWHTVSSASTSQAAQNWIEAVLSLCSLPLAVSFTGFIILLPLLFLGW